MKYRALGRGLRLVETPKGPMLPLAPAAPPLGVPSPPKPFYNLNPFEKRPGPPPPTP
jgi:hypothetical protein